MALSENIIEELDKRLLNLALKDFEGFCLVAGVDKERAYICLAKKAGKSIRTIHNTTGIPRSTIGDICKKCP